MFINIWVYIYIWLCASLCLELNEIHIWIVETFLLMWIGSAYVQLCMCVRADVRFSNRTRFTSPSSRQTNCFSYIKRYIHLIYCWHCAYVNNIILYDKCKIYILYIGIRNQSYLTLNFCLYTYIFVYENNIYEDYYCLFCIHRNNNNNNKHHNHQHQRML